MAEGLESMVRGLRSDRTSATFGRMSARSAWILVAAFACLLLLGPLLAMVRVVAPLAGLAMFILGGAGLFFGGLGLLGLAVFKKNKPVGVPAILALMLCAPLLTSATRGRDAPPINDISTDLSDPPAITVEGRPKLEDHDLNYPADWVEVVKEGYPGLAGKELSGTREEVFAKVVEVAKAQEGWTIHRADPASGILEASAETKLFHFVDDFTVRVVGTKNGARVDMRSRSRDGRGDLGVNAKRIRGFFAEL